ncbi:DnaJ domain-containing protein [Photobacterium minamisatsumaniensis]|uniref:J domain-containing protein n=1 Tax=Photobacterium minamisatsumaniensis TaxID=2910233 RepID=UPI003D0A075B
MTSFHEILGTDNNSTPVEIKRCYKQLSSRCHPDKGGSKTLMQMVSQAYEKVVAGNGHEEAIRTVYLKSRTPNNAANNEWKAKYQKIEIAHNALRHEYHSLDKRLKEALQKLDTNNKTQSDDEERLKAALESDIKMLKRENLRLQRQLESARWEANAKARAVAPSKFTSPLASSSLAPISNTLKAQIHSLGAKNYRKWCLGLFISVLIMALTYSYGSRAWQSVSALFSPEISTNEPVMRILEVSANNDPLVNNQKLQPLTEQILEPPKPLPQIKLISDVGIWALNYYDNTQQPYISVRSEKGSYIVKNCQSDFQYYRNANVRSRRMAANLIFDKHERQFDVYNIPYGNGSFAANWAASKSLLINKEYFPNENFSRSYSELQTHCL